MAVRVWDADGAEDTEHDFSGLTNRVQSMADEVYGLSCWRTSHSMSIGPTAAWPAIR
jgi:hypothetical protein